jgi:hypothetical protein
MRDGHGDSWQSGVWNVFLLWNVTKKQNLLRKHSVAFALKKARNTIISSVKQWHETGSVVPMKQKGPKQTVCMPENIAAVRAAFQQSPTVQHGSILKPLECRIEH